eukprot:363689-Chlamydomonas_euryale.AAC.4
MARLKREEQLGRLGVELSSGKRLQLGGLRGTCRVVIAAGTRAQVCVRPPVPHRAVWETMRAHRKVCARTGVETRACPGCVGLYFYGGSGHVAQFEQDERVQQGFPGPQLLLGSSA